MFIQIHFIIAIVIFLGAMLRGQDVERPEVRIGYLAPSSDGRFSEYANALPSLLEHIAKETGVNLAAKPVKIASFSDGLMKQCPFIYANFDERRSWELDDLEKKGLKQYLEAGGFLFIDAGITASFLRNHPRRQNHSYAAWQETHEITNLFKEIFPGRSFTPLPRNHKLFSAFYKGLPDASLLPDSVREYTIKEKWPDGTYSAVALHLNDRIAVLCTPILAMGWGKNSLGQWSTYINLRVLEEAVDLDKFLNSAAYSGPSYPVPREDGGVDIIYCQHGDKPSWAKEPGDRWRVFRYYSSNEISDFAHVFYTRLGTNIIIHALTQ